MAESLAGEEPCPECGGRGWVIRADGGAGTAHECDCRRRGRGPRLLASAGIPEGYRTKKLGSFRTSHDHPGVAAAMQRALADSRRYVEAFQGADGKFVTHGLLYSGPAGCGKTHLAVGVLSDLISLYRVRGRFVNLTTLVQELQGTFDGGSSITREELLRPVLKADVVVLDELGAQRPSQWVMDLLYYLIDTRYAERRPTLFTTNCSVAEGPRPREGRQENLDRGADRPGRGNPLEQRIDASLVSRLYEMTARIPMDAVEDFRRAVADRGLRARASARP